MLPPGSGMVRQREIMHRNIGKSGIYFDLRSTKCRYHVRYPEFPVPGEPRDSRSSWLLLAARVVFGLLLMSHGIAKLQNFEALSATFPDPLGVGSRVSLVLAVFGEVVCAAGCVAGLLYRLALIPMVFTMCVAFFAVHGGDSFAARELALVYLVVFVLMYAAGPGRYAADTLIAQRIRAPKR